MSGPIYEPFREFFAREAGKALKVVFEKIEKSGTADDETIRAGKILKAHGFRTEEATTEEALSILMESWEEEVV